MLFGDILDGLGDISPGSIINPAVILSFLAIFSASGYILEKSTGLSSVASIIIALTVAIILVSLIHFFILLPMSKAEQSMTFSLNDLIGNSGKVITSIPLDGLGEVLVTQNASVMGYPARSIKNSVITSGERVVIKDVEDGVLIVEPIVVH